MHSVWWNSVSDFRLENRTNLRELILKFMNITEVTISMPFGRYHSDVGSAVNVSKVRAASIFWVE
jgi:hypothetical protein